MQLSIVNLDKISISFIQNHNSIDRPYESFVFTLQNLFLIKKETNKKRDYQIKLGFLQFDQSDPFNLPNPVVITPYKFE